jgi:F420-non-reducing hydrogenase small subunit
MNAVTAILKGELPEKGSVLAPNKALCDTCPRADSKPEKLAIDEVKRPWQIKMDPEKCFLAQGIICMGPATRTGCGETCIKANQPCRGCFGPGVEGEETMSEEEVEKLIDGIADPAGTVYRFSLASSLLKRRRM